MSDPSAPRSQGTGAPTGIDSGRVSAWFEQNIPGVVLPLQFRRVAGGRSNLTFEVRDAAGVGYVLRRPPVSHVLPTAHDMQPGIQDHRGSGTGGGARPAGARGCASTRRSTGPPSTSWASSTASSPAARRKPRNPSTRLPAATAGLALIDTLAQIHAVNPDQAGLGDLGRKDGYIGRQLRRWYANYQAARDSRGGAAERGRRRGPRSAGRPHPGTGRRNRRPRRLPPRQLHHQRAGRGAGGARLGAVHAGRPAGRSRPAARVLAGARASTRPSVIRPRCVPGFPSRTDLQERYAAATGRDLSQLDFYLAFAYWRLACILEGVYSRYVAGAMGDDGFDFSVYPDSIAWLGGQARQPAAAQSMIRTEMS